MKKTVSKQTTFLFVLLMAFAISFGQSRITYASANIKFDTTNVYLEDGRTRMVGVFTNYGDEGATVTDATFQVDITTPDGRYIWSDSGDFSDIDAWVPAGGQVTWTFNINNDNCPEYQGRFKWNVNNRIWWES